MIENRVDVNFGESVRLVGRDMFLYPDPFLFKKVNSPSGYLSIPIVWNGETPNNQYVPGYRFSQFVDGTYGLCMYATTNGKSVVAARSGFIIKGDEMSITHTPQGTLRDFLDTAQLSKSAKRKVLGKLSTGHFRVKMVENLVLIGKQMGLKRVVGTASAQHTKVKHSFLTPEEGNKLMDDVYKEAGFQLAEDGKYFAYNLNEVINA